MSMPKTPVAQVLHSFPSSKERECLVWLAAAVEELQREVTILKRKLEARAEAFAAELPLKVDAPEKKAKK